MNVDFTNNKIKKQLSTASEIKKAFGNMAKKIAQRMDEIRASPTLYVLMQIPAANCHALTGNRKGEWAVDISGNYRLIFEIANEPIPLKEDQNIDTIKVTAVRIIETTDYH